MKPAQLAILLLFPLVALAQQEGGAKPTDPYIEIVKRVQERLHVNGYDIGRIDGVLDERTQGAIAQFQQANALPAGGNMDDETMKALGVDMAEVQVLRAEAASSASTGTSAPTK